ncbi:hypothetical protein AGMMS49936_08130 [Endomicrobiia bacterium]|nr:hypothetical protein AGMMS49936_08130 [Endomicrobiia bacterium]
MAGNGLNSFKTPIHVKSLVLIKQSVKINSKSIEHGFKGKRWHGHKQKGNIEAIFPRSYEFEIL